MTETNKHTAVTYPTEEQYQEWDEEADEMDMSTSEWMQAMIEAGRKKFDASVEPDESAEELREQRNDLQEQLEYARERVEELETAMYHGEQEAIKEFVEEHPGATFGEIVQHVVDTVPDRVTRHLDELEGDALYVDGEEYYPTGGE